IFGSDSLVEPEDLAVDGSGNIFVSDLNKAKVYVFNSDGSCLETKGAGRFSQITIDEKGYLYGVDMDSLKAVKYDENGELIEYYLCWSYPDEIMANDTLIHFAHISIYHDWVTGEVLANYGRSKGYSITKEFLWIPVTFVTDFIPMQSKNSGSIDWFFSFFIPEKERQYEHWIPIDSIEYFNFEEEETPIFKPLLTNPEGGTPPEVEKFELHYLTRRYGTVVWEDTTQLRFTPNDSILIERNAGVFADTGEFILWGDITLDNGQQYPSPKMHNFYIKPSLLSLGMKTDRDIYYPGESVLMSAVVVNSGDTAFTNVTLEILKRDENIFDTLITSLAPQSACSLSTVLSDSNMFVLTGLLFKSGADTVKEYKDVDVVTPPIFFSSTYPCSVDHKPFEVTTEVTNYWEREVDVIFRCSCGDSECIDTLLLYPEESRAIEYQFTIEKDESLETEIIHPVVSHKSYPIRFGEKVEITIDSVITSENSVLIPYYVNNTGEFDCIFDLHLQITDTAGFLSDSTNCTHLLPIGDSLSGEWGINLDYGEYILEWTAKPESSTVILSQGTTSVSIIPQNMVTIDSIVLLTECDSIGMLIFDVSVRNNSPNSFYGNAGLYANFIYETQELELEPLTIDTIGFTSNAVLEEGYHQLTAKILQNGVPLFERTDSLYFTPSIYIDSLPEMLTFNIGDTAEICITTGNRGTSIGEETLSFEFGEFGEETRLISLIPGEVRSDTFIFYLPEDLEERTYYASVWLGNEEYILPVHILGYKILVDATLNQPNFSPGDTVRLNLTIENRNERNLKG
ncbi:hypothetical protein KAX75_04300, partial [candidate division WOR-3 bacterium]|nr:hypothetical protein [candidate division WOR-3 bacterium]